MMNRRRFLELFGLGVAATGIVYSFPDVIVPKNIAGLVSSDIVVPEFTLPSGWYDESEIIRAQRGVPYLVSDTGDFYGRTWSGPYTSRIFYDQDWFESLPKDRSLIPEDYRRGV